MLSGSSIANAVTVARRLVALRAEQPTADERAREAQAVREGWIAGLRLMQLIGANSRYFTDTSQKPPIDVAAGSRHTLLNLRWRQPLGEKLTWSVAFRSYEEQRGNGTPYQRNGTRERALAVEFAGQPADAFAWKATAYAQDQGFSSTFSGVNATRTAETPASELDELIATLGEFNMAQRTHAEKYRIASHGRIDAGAHVGEQNPANLQFANGGRVHDDIAIGRAGSRRSAALEAGCQRQFFWQHDVGRAGVQQEHRPSFIDEAAGDIVALRVSA